MGGPTGAGDVGGGQGPFEGLVTETVPPPDLEKRSNPVCHFVTPLDGSVEVDEHRRPEVSGT